MDKNQSDFTQSESVDPHISRRREILTKHPEIKGLFGRDRNTSVFILLLVSCQLAIAFWLRDASWIWILVTAYFAGAFFNHALFCLKHECAHGLVFKNKTANYWLGIFANLPSCTPTFVTFSTFHLKHHSHQGEYEMDADLPHKWEAKLIQYTPFGKILWLAIHPIIVSLRPLRFENIHYFDKWMVFNIVIVIAFDLAIIFLMGPMAFLYLFLSTIFGLGLHPVGARWIQEHYVVNPPQETYSYYGILNKITFNIGYHNEHHDFPGIPWSRLPKLRSTASEYYDTLYYHTSWVKLLYKFFTDPSLTLFSRVEREPKRARV